jgi:hypothetical protein
MAIQNFISGGFYGKLGEVVGQRWRNKRTLRAHVIPKNPRTPEQQANRALFKRATELAQKAFNVNKGSPLWDTSLIGQFSQMVSLAYKRLKAGLSDSQSLPLYPEGITPNVIINNLSVDWSQWPQSVLFKDNDNIINTERIVEILITAKNELTKNFEQISITHTISANTSFSFSFSNQNIYSLPEGSSITVASRDDDQHDGASLFIPPVFLSQNVKPIIPIPLSFKSPVLNQEAGTVRINLFDIPLTWDINIPVSITCYNRNSNLQIINTGYINFESVYGNSILLNLLADQIYKSGTKINAGGKTFELETADIYFYWSAFSFSVANMTHNVVLNNLTVNWQYYPNFIIFSDNQNISEFERDITISVYNKNELRTAFELTSYNTTISANTPFSFTLDTGFFMSFPTGSYFYVTSNDSNLFYGSSVSSPYFFLTQPSKPTFNYQINFNNVTVDRPNRQASIFINTANHKWDTELDIKIYCYSLVTNRFVSYDDSITLLPNSTFVGSLDLEDMYSYRSGTYIQPGTNTIEFSTCFVKFSWSQFNFTAIL